MPTTTEKRIAFFYAFSKFVIAAKEAGIDLLITTVYRTAEEQNACFKAGQSQCDGYIKRSRHQDWLAIDCYPVKGGEIVWSYNEDYETLGQSWKDMGMTWGGDFSFKDYGHFEYKEPDE